MQDTRIWTPTKCKDTLNQQRILNGMNKDEFWRRIFAWHNDQYAKAKQPKSLPWADKCLEAMQEAEKEMGLDTISGLTAAAQTFKAQEVLEAPKKKSIFDKLKEDK